MIDNLHLRYLRACYKCQNNIYESSNINIATELHLQIHTHIESKT